jgi:hypothetical protein
LLYYTQSKQIVVLTLKTIWLRPHSTVYTAANLKLHNKKFTGLNQFFVFKETEKNVSS